ncbi:hypothetical protein BGV06_19810, partial [Clostridioides difficile]
MAGEECPAIRLGQPRVVVVEADQAVLQGQALGMGEHFIDAAAGLDRAGDRQVAIAFQPEPAGQFGGVMLAQGIVEGGDLDQVGLDDAAGGGGLRKQPGEQRGEALQAGAGVGHVGGGEADVGQGFGARRDGRVEPLARTQG